MMFSLACRCNSFTHDFALSKDDYTQWLAERRYRYRESSTYGLCDIIDYHSAVSVPVVHGCQRLVSFLTSCVPYFELYGCVLIERDSLCQERSADR